MEQTHSNVMSTFIYGLPVKMDLPPKMKDFENSTCKGFHGKVVHLTCQAGNGDSIIYMCDDLLGYTVHFPRSYINHFVSTCLPWRSSFSVETLLLFTFFCFMISLDLISFKTGLCCKVSVGLLSYLEFGVKFPIWARL